jgi:hypothetical protein
MAPVAPQPLPLSHAQASECSELVSAAIDEAVGRKPKGHDFVIDRVSKKPPVARHMSVTGGAAEALKTSLLSIHFSRCPAWRKLSI